MNSHTVEIIGLTVIGGLLVILCAFLGALMGAFSGWIIGFTPIGDWILGFLVSMNIHTNMVDLGTFAGFVGGFFRSSSSIK